MSEIGTQGYLSFPGFSGNDMRGALALIGSGAISTYAMPAQNNGWCARIVASNTKDIKSVKLYWSSVAVAGTVQLRIETINTATGKPTGTLYDAAATKDFTPVAGAQTVTFDVLPTTGRVAGTAYGIVLLTTVAGTTHTLGSYITSGSYPVVTFEAADASTRTNFAAVTNSQPVCTLVFDDDTEESEGMTSFYYSSATKIYGSDEWSGVKFSVVGDTTVRGIAFDGGALYYTGTPTGDLRFRIFTNAGALVTNATATLPLAYYAETRGGCVLFPVLATLTNGSYRIVLDSAASGTSNCWMIRRAVSHNAKFVPSGFNYTKSTNAGTSWTETTTEVCGLSVILDAVTDATPDYPTEANVRKNTVFGNLAYTGTCYVPAAADVEFGVNVDATTGTFVVPAVADVEDGVTYGAAAEFTGTLAAGSGDWNASEKSDILDAVTAINAAFSGTSELNANVTKVLGVGVLDSGTVDANVTQFAGKTVTCAAGVTVGPYVGNATAAIVVNADGCAHADWQTAKGYTLTVSENIVVGAFVGNDTHEIEVDVNGYVYLKGCATDAIAAAGIKADAVTKIAAGVISNAAYPINVNTSGHVTPADGSLTTTKLGSPFVLAKTTNITGFNDIAATSIVSSGAITTSAGAVSSVTTAGTVNALAADAVNSSALATTAITEIANALAALFPGYSFKKNTAFLNFEFYMTSASDHVTTITGRTVTAQRSIDGAAFASCTNAVTEVTYGVYKISFSAADLNGNCVTFRFTAEGADPKLVTVITQP